VPAWLRTFQFKRSLIIGEPDDMPRARSCKLTKLPLHPEPIHISVLALLAANVSQVLLRTRSACSRRLAAGAHLILAFRARTGLHKADYWLLVLALFFSLTAICFGAPGFLLGPVLIRRTAVLLPLWGSNHLLLGGS
jgi:hypothetical protein